MCNFLVCRSGEALSIESLPIDFESSALYVYTIEDAEYLVSELEEFIKEKKNGN